ncbi:hypothetical protein KRP22_014385 [Phytophthora ramorum]|nr:hypothetical protein KRP22_9011 [Phytophthora ramorum]
MALNLVEDVQVLEAAMSFLDECNGGDSTINKRATGVKGAPKKKKARNYNPNRAREEQYKELLALREQVPELERKVMMLQQEMQISTPSAVVVGQNETMELWRKLATYQRQTRLNAEEENKRLRELVREQAEVSTRTIQELLQLEEGHVETIEKPPDAWSYRRQYAVPLVSADNSLFREMADSIDFVHQQVLRVFSMSGAETDVTPKNAHPRLFADKILPFSVELTGDAAWQFFAHSFRRPTTRFYYHAESTQTSGLVRDDTIVESFGEEHHFGKVLLDVKVKQIVRRYMAAGRVVTAWRAILIPETFKGESLSGIQFEEKGALVIEPCQVAQPSDVHETASVVRTWQMVTPDISCTADPDRRKVVQDMTEYVLHGCRPGRAVESMERTLRAQSMQRQVVLPIW